METAQHTLAITGLRAQFQTPQGVLTAVDGIDLTIPRGTIVGLVGSRAAEKASQPCRCWASSSPPAG